MKKMLKIIAMLLVIATVVFAAGCAGKTTEKTNVSTQTVQENTSIKTVPAGDAVNVTDDVTNVTNVTTENVTTEK
jgi:PBP1b-binding outer membrane lipoprotein LpoB